MIGADSVDQPTPPAGRTDGLPTRRPIDGYRVIRLVLLLASAAISLSTLVWLGLALKRMLD
ncbi:hypothetical protein [Amaricoccus solimangrovi]|uniref:Uncharacterized protein n=1 Tax=Amaricoccus solimangrovi TaxID=2589815 RepID=A0A501WK30_9RHOB|nr:hypothetical protein [Amaricoccus solimangrovi]TPE47391.1 hypothetical protein FJM51_20185 [Amaricoccus solimangrovi]